MSDCVSDSVGVTCLNCGWKWKRGGEFPRRNCPGPPLTDADFAAAVAELPVMANTKQASRLGQKIVRWIRSGKPIRQNARDLAGVPCDQRHPGGITCLAASAGCIKERVMNGQSVPCWAMATMGTEACPEKHFGATL